ncbi:hypothetical protein OIU76_011185 [Salix suchowensis]|nr:hypothetical protein OIU76_011185 [Salix suchowensis]
MGLTKGQWTRRSDFDPLHSKLLPYSNWRALPKQAGAWPAIASRLPGRTDNEIKNVWHTHLKKRLGHDGESMPQQCIRLPNCHVNDTKLSESANPTIPTRSGSESIGYAQVFPQSSSSDHSSVTNTSITTAETNSTSMIKIDYMDPFEIYPVIDENSWSEPRVVENSSMPSNYLDDLQFPFPSADTVEPAGSYGYAPDTDDDMKFWHNFFR